ERSLRHAPCARHNQGIANSSERVPDLSRLHAHTLAAIPPERLQAEITRRTTEASSRIDSSITGRFQSISSMNSARLNCQALITEFEALAAKLPDGPTKTALTEQVAQLKAKVVLVQAPINRIERSSELTTALN